MKKILITGGSGLIGMHLTHKLLDKKHRVVHLSRGEDRSHPEVPSYQWDVMRGTMDLRALEGVTHIVHLAGANVMKRWTKSYKTRIVASRVKSAALLYRMVQRKGVRLQAFIAASALGYYGDGGEQWLSEDHSPAPDFLGNTCRKWETAADRFANKGCRVVKVRIGFVLAREGGALPIMAFPVKCFAGAPLGSGKQYTSWIHIDDLAGIFYQAVEDDKMRGAFNGCAPHPVTNRAMIRMLGKVLKRPVFLPAIPAVVLRIVMGEMGNAVLYSVRCKADKVQQAGYRFQYPALEAALRDLLG